MSFKTSWNEVFESIKQFANSEGISNVGKGGPDSTATEAPFLIAFAKPLKVKFGEGSRSQRKSMEILAFVGDADEDLSEGIERATDTAERLGDFLAGKYPDTFSIEAEFDSVYANNIIASLTIQMFYKR